MSIERDNPGENAWQLLTTRATNWEWSPSDHEGLTQAEVAGMLAGLDRTAYYAGMLCLAERWDCLKPTVALLRDFAIELASEEQWDMPTGPKPLTNLVYCAIFEMTGPSFMCPTCDGLGRIERPGATRRVCTLCEGSGRIPRTQRSRAELVGVTERSWHRVWKGRYMGVHGELNNWVSDARTHLARKLGQRRRVSA